MNIISTVKPDLVCRLDEKAFTIENPISLKQLAYCTDQGHLFSHLNPLGPLNGFKLIQRKSSFEINRLSILKKTIDKHMWFSRIYINRVNYVSVPDDVSLLYSVPELLLSLPSDPRAYPTLLGVLLSFLTWHAMYLDSAVPGVDPPTPLSPSKYRSFLTYSPPSLFSLSRVHFHKRPVNLSITISMNTIELYWNYRSGTIFTNTIE